MNVAWTCRTLRASSLVVTSPLPGDGKTTTTANLAITLAQRGYRVLLVDADLRRGQIGTLLRAPESPGLGELLRGTSTLEDAVRTTDVGGEHVLAYVTAGAPLAHSAALLHSDRMRTLNDQFRRSFEIVLYDTPPLNAVSDAAVLGSLADGVIMVARAGVTPAGALALAAEQLRIARAAVCGIVLNDVDPRRDDAYAEAYQYYAPLSADGGVATT
jgi:capsular exopolysaccharide synthesis family protein